MTPRRQREAATVLLACLAALLVVLVTAALVEAAVFTTDATGDEADASPGDGTCAKSGGGCTLQAAVDEVNARNAGDTIRHEVATTDGDGVTITVSDITIDGTQATGFVPCTGWDCSAANWVGTLDMDGGTGIGISFADGTTGAVVKGVRVFGGAGTTDYGIILASGVATANRVHDLHGGIMCKGAPCTIGGAGANDANWAHEIVDFGFTAQGNGAVIRGNVGCLAADGESDAGAMDYMIYVEDADDAEVIGNLGAGCDVAAVRVKETSDRTAIEDNRFGPTRSGATTLCSGFTAFSDAGVDTTYTDNTLCPPPPGCCNIDGLPGIVTCLDYSVLGGTAPTSQAECETIIDDIVGEPDTASATSYNADAVCDPDALGSCPAANTPTATATATGTNTATATEPDTPTATATATGTSTETPTVTATGTVTDTPTQTATATGTVTDTPTATATSTETGTATDTPTATATETPTATSTGTVTDTPTSTATETGTATQTATATTTPTATPTPTDTPTGLASPTATKAKRLRHYKIRVPRVRAVPG